MLVVPNVRLPLDAALPGHERLVRRALATHLSLVEDDIAAERLVRRSIDARHHGDVCFVATLHVDLRNAEDEATVASAVAGVSQVAGSAFSPERETRSNFSAPPQITDGPSGRQPPVVVGSGPAGLFAALRLAEAGRCPILIERGSQVEERRRKVDEFIKTGILGMQSNVQFGEGGAGTFSDGKLTTNTRSPLNRAVLETFVCAGAPTEILWQAKPHIGTDRLVEVVGKLRQRIEECGGHVLFDTRLESLLIEKGELCGAHVRCAVPLKAEQFISMRSQLGSLLEDAGCDEPLEAVIPTDTIVLATGHSARDTYEMLHEVGVCIEPKAFSIGVRIEHEQTAIDRSQYGSCTGHPALEPASYKLVEHLPGGRNVYTFCMCPGGTVIPAASEIEGVVTNGMSTFARNGRNANAALLVDVRPTDFGSDHPLAGIAFQRRWEQAAYRLGGGSYQAPAQYVGDFLAGRSSATSEVDASVQVQPSYPRGVVWSDLCGCLPLFVTDALVEALPLLDRRLKGFASSGAVMTGVETRSSAPVTVLRDAAFRSNIGGLYPCGEGAGYAGGIMSAAVDGLRVAEAVLAR
jgi:uncharacterized protein